jgi:hypothetical protein
MQEDVGCVGATAYFIVSWCNNQRGKAAGLHRRGKNIFMHHSTPRTMRPMRHGIRQPYLKRVPRLPWGLPNLRVRTKNPSIRSEPPRATRARNEATQRVANSWLTWCPIEGTRYPQASYLSPDRKVFFTPFVWARIELFGFSTRLPGKDA